MSNNNFSHFSNLWALALTRLWPLYLGAVVFGSVVLLGNGCDQVRLSRMEQKSVSAKSVGQLCSESPYNLNPVIKFLFVVDKSGSNAPSAKSPGSDPGGIKRIGGIKKFFASYKDNPNYQFGLIGFNAKAAKAYVKDESGMPTFTSDQNEFKKGLAQLKNAPDFENTPYVAALGMADLAIKNDLIKSKGSGSAFTVYMIFFLSDGVPTDSPLDKQIEINTKHVAQIVANNLGNVFLSTGFYGPTNPAAELLLQEMAKVGFGTYTNFGESDEIDFTKIIVQAAKDPWVIRNLITYNLNSGFCLDGSVSVDSDSDGLCDKDEIQLAAEGFDPTKRFSFGDGYGDLFHWRVMAFGGLLKPCEDRSDADSDFLTTCEENIIFNQSPLDGIPFSGDLNNPDTDSDGFIDGIETFVFYPNTTAFAMDPTNVIKTIFDGEGDSAGVQIAQHRNPLVPDANAMRYDTQLIPIGVNDQGQSCYSFSQSVLWLENTLEVKEEDTLVGLGHPAGVNVISIHYLEAPQSAPTRNGLYKYSLQYLSSDPALNALFGTAVGLKVTPEVFKNYVIPK